MYSFTGFVLVLGHSSVALVVENPIDCWGSMEFVVVLRRCCVIVECVDVRTEAFVEKTMHCCYRTETSVLEVDILLPKYRGICCGGRRTVVSVLRCFVSRYQRLAHGCTKALFADVVKYLLTCLFTKQSAQTETTQRRNNTQPEGF